MLFSPRKFGTRFVPWFAGLAVFVAASVSAQQTAKKIPAQDLKAVISEISNIPKVQIQPLVDEGFHWPEILALGGLAKKSKTRLSNVVAERRRGASWNRLASNRNLTLQMVLDELKSRIRVAESVHSEYRTELQTIENDLNALALESETLTPLPGASSLTPTPAPSGVSKTLNPNEPQPLRKLN